MKHLLLLAITCMQMVVFSQENQNIQFSKIETGSYAVFKTISKGYEKYVFEQAKKNWPVELFKEGDVYPKILVKRVGIIDEFYTADLPSYPAYYLTKASTTVVTVIDKKIYYYTWTASKGAVITYILTNGKVGSYIAEKEQLDNYRRAIKSKQSGSRDERKELNAAIAAKEAEENTLKGKSIKAIKVKLIDPNIDAGMFSIIPIGMEVTLTNGKVLKTKNLGGKTPYTDFESSTTGGNFAGGDFKVDNDTRNIPGDKITLKVWSKYNSSISAKLEHPLNYRNNAYYNFQGNGGAHGRSGARGGLGKDGKSVNITAEKMTINGNNVTKITIRDVSYRVLYEAKINIENTVTINAKGGNGGSGDSGFGRGNGAAGGDGGNGGQVSVSGSGASQIKMIIQVQGGNGGAGGKREESYNKDGRNGTRGANGTSNK
ncbi:hypothetical protein DNU06_12150 [Putridiphycobacter roseus]|uniref:Uncharacterized protein n=2 Tax=Putridiphycobacter roseus TaxID=2219161 RepID=A0A2W1MWU9_9FLAO|nr:hypothetical protein [Putridiphycobacter roseus]PZE16599.1 hypothetical protein DNU06_12150 [Putridiphycobacter roseus]